MRSPNNDAVRRIMTTIVGVAWYSAAEWAQLRAIAPDADKLEATYDEWVAVAEKGLRDLRSAGLAPERVPVRLDLLRAWCDARGRRPDAAARAEYAAAELQRIHESRAEQADGC